MAKIQLRHNPTLTKELLAEALKKHFEPMGYEVGMSSLIGADIYVKKNNWVGCTLKLKQKADSTTVIANGYTPSILYRILFYGLLTIIILSPKWRALIAEIRAFLEAQ